VIIHSTVRQFFFKVRFIFDILVWTTHFTKRLFIAFSSVPNFTVYLPSDSENRFLLNITIFIRDKFHCITEFNISSVVVRPDTERISSSIASFQGSIIEKNNDPIVRLLSGKNPNTVGQLIIILSRALAQLNLDNLYDIISSNEQIFSNKNHFYLIAGVPPTSLFISSLGTPKLQIVTFLSTTHFSFH
jgi:hypothetical protein